MKRFIRKTGIFTLILVMSMSMNVFAYSAEQGNGYRDASRQVEINDNFLDLNALPYRVGEGYVEFDIPLDQLFVEVTPFASSPLVGNFGVLNAFFNPGQTQTQSGLAVFDWRIASIPITAQITSVTLNSQRTNVPNVTYFIGIGRVTNNFASNLIVDNWAPDLLWSSTVQTNWFNGQDPYGVWAFDILATRIIPNPQIDFGAAATLNSATLRVNFR
ncbi:MAG: hypothetical protein FWG64_12330 [Firmicutes bacterium]|nr:hypothetical protein [Bacillota bacterium]